MKSKIKSYALLLVAFGLAACGNQPAPSSSYTQQTVSSSADGLETKQREIYELYVRYAQSNGVTPKTYEEWLASIKGEKGSSLLHGTSDPTDSLGSNGDVYVNTKSWDVFVKGSGSWFKVGNIMGEQGAKGDKGDKGEQGAQGEKGETGESAYEAYLKSHPEYEGDEQQWLDDLVNGKLGNQEKTYFTVTFDLGHDGLSFTQKVEDGKKAKKPEDPERSGYGFVDWADGNGDHWVFNGFSVNEDITLHAVWSDPIEYIAVFLNNDGTELWRTTGHYGDALEYGGGTPIAASQNPHYIYSFKGWNKELTIIGNMEFTAVYDTVYIPTTAYFYDEDKKTLLDAVVLAEGESAKYSGDISALAHRDEENRISYQFGSWEVFEETDSVIKYYARYNELVDGLLIENGVVKKYNGSDLIVRIPEKWNNCITSSIHYSAFMDCRSISQVVIPKSIQDIPTWCFRGCYNLESIEAAKDSPFFYSIDGVLFNKLTNELLICPNKKQGIYDIPEGTKSIAQFGFADCRSLEKVCFADSILRIKDQAFIGCSGLSEIVLNDKLEAIEGGAFYGCISLLGIKFPASVREIDGGAFVRTNFANFEIDSQNPFFKVEEGILYTKDGKTLVSYPRGRNGSFAIPNGITAISEGAFSEARVTEIIIPGSVKQISDYAFDCCSQLSSVIIEEGVESIGGDVFRACSALVSISLPDSLVAIGNWAFACDNLTTIYVPKGVSSIGWSPFCGKALEQIEVSDENQTFSSIDGVLFNKEQTELIAFPRGRKGDYSVPEGVTVIGRDAFRGSDVLTSVLLSSTVIETGTQAFSDSKNLRTVILNPGIKRVLTSFESSGIVSIILPESLEDIGGYEFQNCKNLEKVYYEGTKGKLRSIIKYGGEWPDSDYVYYLSEKQPQDEGHYWHYVDGVPTIW